MHSLDCPAVTMMFICLSGMGVHCDRMVQVITDLSLRLDSPRLDSPMLCAPWHQSMYTYSKPFFSSSTWKRRGIWMCKLGVISEGLLKTEVNLLLSANRKSCKLCCVDWHNNGWLWVFEVNVIRIVRYLCSSWASCCNSHLSTLDVVNAKRL